MANWETDVSVSTRGTKSYAQNTADTRDAGRTKASSTQSKSGSGLFGLGGYSVVGMKVESIDSVCNALDAYVDDIMTYLDGIEENAATSGAFRSENNEVETAVREYITNVETYCKNLVSQLKAFSDKLVDVKNKWVERTGKIAGVITQDVGASDTGTTYTRQL